MGTSLQKVAIRPAYEHLLTLLDDLPPASLALVERFVEFLHEHAQRGQPVVMLSEQEEKPPYLYPTVTVPTLDGLIGIMPPVGGDALADTEALYDEV